jgi:hypothetical protein
MQRREFVKLISMAIGAVKLWPWGKAKRPEAAGVPAVTYTELGVEADVTFREIPDPFVEYEWVLMWKTVPENRGPLWWYAARLEAERAKQYHSLDGQDEIDGRLHLA